ncbi:Demethylrebeccamycin-D-glucose O-methyltransferase [compost metagenome]
MNPVTDYYEQYDEDARLKRDHSGKLEFLTTTHLLDRYLASNHALLDLGAGTGIYSFYYADRGNAVVSTDLTPKHVEVIQERIQAGGYDGMSTRIADASDLSYFEDGSFDAVLCLGPLYHLTDTALQNRCLSEALRVLKPGGILAAAYVNKFFIFPYLVKRDRRFLKESWMERLLEQGRISAADEDCFWTDAYFHTPQEIEDLMDGHGIVKLEHAGTDGIGVMLEERIDELDDKEFELWMAYHLRTCSEPSILGISNHGLYIGRKA